MKASRKARLYLNQGIYLGSQVVKVGYSVNPESRLSGFNCGCKWRYRLGHSKEQVTFSGLFRSAPMAAKDCRMLESEFISSHSSLLIPDLGQEVFAVNPSDAVEALSALIKARGGR